MKPEISFERVFISHLRWFGGSGVCKYNCERVTLIINSLIIIDPLAKSLKHYKLINLTPFNIKGMISILIAPLDGL